VERKKGKKILGILMAFCMIVTSVVNVQEVKVRAEESANNPVTYEYFDNEGNPASGTCNDYAIVDNVATVETISVASGGAISVASGGAISVVSGGAISVVSGGAISVVSGGAISVVSGGAISVVSGGAISVATGAAVIWDGNEHPWYVVDGNLTVTERIKVTPGTSVNLILKNGSKLIASKGITVSVGSSLSIYGQFSNGAALGQLIAQGEAYNAGIGGEDGQCAGTIIINGGRIAATGGYGAAGIGGGWEGSGGSITISGGTVIATGGNSASGIGAGRRGVAGELAVSSEMKAFASSEDSYGYSEVTSGMTNSGRYSIVYPEHSGIMSSSGNTITATYIDPMGYKSSVQLSLVASSMPRYINPGDPVVQLENLDYFNSVLGKTGTDAVSESQIRYYNSNGELLNELPRTAGNYSAAITVDGVTAVLDFYANINPPVQYETLDNEENPIVATCSEYTVVTGSGYPGTTGGYYPGAMGPDDPDTTGTDSSVATGGAITWGERSGTGLYSEGETWYVAYGDVYINDLVTVVGNVNLILMNGCNLIANKGINVDAANRLAIYRQVPGDGNMGHLSVYGEPGQAGIGGGEGQCLGTVSIYGGNITAYGGAGAAAIGNGKDGTSFQGLVAYPVVYGPNSWNRGIVAIFGGEITATGGRENASGYEMMPIMDEDEGADAIGSGCNAVPIYIYISPRMKAFVSVNEWMYTPVTETAGSNTGRFALVYPEHSGIMSVYGNTVYATNVDAQGYRSGASLSLDEPVELYGDDESTRATLGNAESFNAALGKTDEYAVSESQIRYFGRDGVELGAAPTQTGSYTAKITVDSVTLSIDYEIGYVYVTDNDTYWDGSVNQCYIVSGTVNVDSRIWVSGKVNLLLMRGAALNANKGINVSWGATLNIYEEPGVGLASGHLYAHGDEYQAGIGGDYYGDGGTIIINGGEIDAHGGYYAAGIGGGYGGAGGTVTINGGKVTAAGDMHGSGIGSGRYWDRFGTGYVYGGDITINGGIVTATGRYGAAGIGGGHGGSGGNIRITGGSIYANGLGSSGIGGGSSGPGGNITITGGTIISHGSEAGIGCNSDRYRGTISIADGMKAYSSPDEVNYTRFYREGNDIENYAIVYGEGSGFMEANGNTITATYIDQNGVKQTVATSITAHHGDVYGDAQDLRATLINIDEFNAALGKSGENAISEADVEYCTWFGRPLAEAPSTSGEYCAKLTLEGVTASWRYISNLNPPVSYTYFDNELTAQTGSCEDYGVVKSGSPVLDGTLHEWYIVHGNVSFDERVTVSGAVDLIVMDGAVLNANGGINVASGSALNIYVQSFDNETTGRIYANAQYGEAGIGGGNNETAGNITINGGIINAQGGYSGAGIGGGSYGHGGTTTINAGTVYAAGGIYGAGIGGGDWYGEGGFIVVNGGRITAVGGSYGGAGIGGGWYGNGGNIVINDGEVTATADEYGGTGIGAGVNGSAGTITLSDEVKAFASSNQNSNYNVITTGATPGGRYALVYNKHRGVMSVAGNTITSEYIDANGNKSSTQLILTAPLNLLYKVASSSIPTLTNLEEFNGIWERTGADAVSESQIRYYMENGDRTYPAPTQVGNYTAKITVEGLTAVLNYAVTEPEYTLVNASDTVWSGTPQDCFVARGHFSMDNRVTVSGTVNLVMLDGCDFKALKGISVPEGSTLNIYGQGREYGGLTATGQENQAGIGGGNNETAGTINIYSGTVIATGGYSGAGIGGGSYGSGGNINIYGGRVEATGGTYGAGIGGGDWNGAGGNITINGGEVTANGGEYGGAGIGGGWCGAGGNITVNGGIVTATGSYNAAGIGGGCSGAGGTVTINGGGIFAAGGEYGGAGIGAGSYGPEGTLILSDQMKALASSLEESEYSEIVSGTTDSRRYCIAYRKYGGIMTVSGQTINAEYIDANACKNSVSLTLGLPGVSSSGRMNLINVENFNAELGRTGDKEINGDSVKYYGRYGVELANPPTTAGGYSARLTVDEVMVEISYAIFGG